MEHSWILLIAMVGHILCVYADRLLLCTPGGQFGFSAMKDNSRMAELFGAKPESDPLRSIVLGTLAMFLQFFGYLALVIWMRQYTALWANLMIVGATMIGCYVGILLFSVAHFVPVVMGMTPLPAWACVFNLLPLFLVQAPFNIPGAGNIAGTVMYLGLFIMFLI